MGSADTIEIAVGEGEGARTIALRRPTAGECDVLGISGHVQVFLRAQGRIAEVEAAPVEGVSTTIANLTFVANDALGQVRDRVRKALVTCAGAEAVAWLDGLEGAAKWQAILDIAGKLAKEFAVKPAARLGK